MKYFYLLIACVSMSCSPIATFPPIETEAATKWGDAARKPVPRIMALVINYAHEHYGWTDEIVYNLPEGVGADAYSLVGEMLANATPMTSDGQPAYHITELRVRGLDAEADVVMPTKSGEYQMVTLRLETSPFNPWSVTYDRLWAMPIHDSPSPTFSAEEFVNASNKNP